MAARKKEPPKVRQRDLTARLCGTLSGTSDHIARMQQEIINIAGRCVLALGDSEEMPRTVIPEEDRAFFTELKTYCETRFGNLVEMRKRVEAVLVKANSYHPGPTD